LMIKLYLFIFCELVKPELPIILLSVAKDLGKRKRTAYLLLSNPDRGELPEGLRRIAHRLKRYLIPP